MKFDPDVTACAALVERADPDRFAACMASPVASRRVLFPLYAFTVEVSRAPWVTQESMIAEMRLQWWRDALEEIGKGVPVRHHEVTTPLSGLLDAEGAGSLDRLVAARRWDIYRDPFEDAAHFERYIDETAAGLMWVAFRTLGGSRDMEGPVRRVGRAAGLARFFQAVPELEAQNRVPLVDGRPETVAALAAEALRGFDLRRLRRQCSPAAGAALTEAFLAGEILTRVARTPSLVARGALQIPALRRSWLLWRAS